MDIDDIIYLEHLYKRLNRWNQGQINALVRHYIGGYTIKEIATMPECFGLSQYCDTVTRAQTAIGKGKRAIQTEHAIETHWGRV